MTLEKLLISMGVNITSNVIYDWLKNFFQDKLNPTKKELIIALSGYLDIQNAKIYSEKIINLLAENGYLNIEGTNIYANEILMSGTFSFGNNSISETKSGSKIIAGQGAYARGTGGIKQDGNGNVYIWAGRKNN